MNTEFRAPTLLSPALQLSLVVTSILGLLIAAGTLVVGHTDAEIEAFASQGDVEALLTVGFGLTAILYFVTFVTCVVLFPMFMYRATKNLHALGHEFLNTTPGMAAGGWFIPFGNLVIPYRALVELDRTSEGTEDYTANSTISLYWGCWIVANLLSRIGERVPEVGMVASVVLAVAGGLAVSIVRKIDASQRRRATSSAARDLAPVFA